MPNRRLFKTGESFLEKLAIGAIGSPDVFAELARQVPVSPSEALCKTQMGEAYVGDSLELLTKIPDESVDLVITSPPFALQREKEYGNKNQDDYVDWLLQFAEPVKRVLKQTGSFVLDLGGAYISGRPVRSIEILKRQQEMVLREERVNYNNGG